MISIQIVRLKEFLKKKIKNKAISAFLGRVFFIISGVIIWFRNNFFKSSIFIFEYETSMASLFPRKIIDKAIEMVHPLKVLDLGCGVGRSLDYFISQGVDCFGIEGSSVAISKANHPERIMLFDLSKELDLKKKYDLIWSFEFVEHIHPRHINNLMKTFVNHSNTVIISAAQPGQGGDGHFNEQSQSYWVAQFNQHGYDFNIERTEELRSLDEQFSKNMYVFERKP
jgi:2-polyprenyl-3-methyl-5-hydroxy-6-metoxy-1,4-benzoquinol methylase